MQTKLEYLDFLEARTKETQSQPSLWATSASIKAFSDPLDEDNYGDDPITDDLVTDVYMVFSVKTRQPESEKYLKTLTGEWLVPIWGVIFD